MTEEWRRSIDVPNFSRRPLRLRVALELGILFILMSILVIYLSHDFGIRVAAAFLLAFLICLRARETKELIWGETALPRSSRLLNSALAFLVFTVPLVMAFFLWSVRSGHHFSYVSLLLGLCIYIPWALVQQIIFQFYLLGRLRILLPSISPFFLVIMSASLYGLAHMPNIKLVLLTFIPGVVWSYSYLRNRYLLPIVASHAVIGVAFFYFVGNNDFVNEFLIYTNKLL